MAIIWLPSSLYKNNQTCNYSFWEKENRGYSVVNIIKDFHFEEEIESIDIKFSVDTACYIYINNKLEINSNIKSYGDFITNGPNKVFYYGNKNIKINSNKLDISIFAKSHPTKLYDYSSGNGGFILKGIIHFKNNQNIEFETDESWKIKLLKSFSEHQTKYDSTCQCFAYDQRNDNEEYVNAEVKKYDWQFLDTTIKTTIETQIKFNNVINLKPFERKRLTIDFDRIYSSYFEIEATCDGLLEGNIQALEVQNKCDQFSFKFIRSGKVRYFDLHSIGKLKISLKNETDKPASIKINCYHSYYPYENIGYIKSDNKKLNDLFDKCKFAILNCSQNILLDSPKHLEPLSSCSGDYYIESLVTAVMTGDFELVKHVLRGYSDLLDKHNGQNANLSYSLVFVFWLYKIYMMTGDKELLKYCLKGASKACELYLSFVDENGIVDHPYTYCFLDWLIVDGFNLFIPPMALGETAISVFYYHAIESLMNIYKELGDDKSYRKWFKEVKKTKKGINTILFNKEKGLYCEGLNTPTPDDYVDKIWNKPIPKNTDKTYYRKHANSLAVAYGLTNKLTSKKIVKKLFNELKDCEIQPYFMHYEFEAIHEAGLDKKYAMKLIKEWTSRIKYKDKGLPEGFFKPTPDYKFDYSHGWGASPYYSFIVASSGLKILEPGMRKIELSPKSLGVKNLKYSLGTPFGFIEFDFSCQNPVISAPREIEIVIK